jgi:alanine dehydrogenase
LKIGVPRERKQGESRVGITPDGTAELSRNGHTVLVETNAGLLSGFSDKQYVAAGASIQESLSDVWQGCDLLVKVKEPDPEEYQFFRKDLSVFSFLHPAACEDLTNALVSSGVIALDYDLLALPNGRLPLLEPMSEIAGKLAIQCGAYAMQTHSGGPGILLGGSIGVPAARVVVVGAGVAGSNAARVAIGMGADVSILDINPDRLAAFTDTPLRARTVFSSESALAREIALADLVIGAVLVPGDLAPKLITKKMLAQMKEKAVIVDICIDQGGFAETSRATSLAEPTYVEDNVIHYCVPNMPAMVPRTSTIALSNATLPWIKKLSNLGLAKAIDTYQPLREALLSVGQGLCNPIVGDALGIKCLSEKQLREKLSQLA